MTASAHVVHRVLILAPTGRDGALAQSVIQKAGLSAMVVTSADELCLAIDEDTGAVLVAEEALSPHATQLLSSILSAQPEWSDLPLLVLASPLDAQSSTARFDQLLRVLGNVTIIERPLRISTLVVGLKAALRARGRQYAARNTLLELGRREAELKLADQRKNEFLAMLAHELRNPMAALTVAVERWKPGDDPVGIRHRDIARRQNQNLVRLVDDLLDVSRITRGTVELIKRQIDFAEVVRNAVSAARPTIERSQHQLEVDIANGRYLLSADATRVEQIVANLLSNAAKYTEPGGRIVVQLRNEVEGHRAVGVLSVSDNGRGIPAAMLDRIFDLFVQVDQGLDRALGGLGLGLTLVRRLAEMHGGTVGVRSEGEGQGSEFTVRLPLSLSSDAVDGQHFDALRTPAQVMKKRRVLVVDDSEDIRESLKDLLEAMGHDVSLASTGTEGARQVLSLRPDVALIDVGLPGMSGYEVARHVRAQPGGDDLYLVALTGYGGSEAREKSREAGFDLHLTKPLDLKDLPRVLGR